MDFLGWLLSLLAKLGLNAWLHRGPSRLEVQSIRVGELESDLATAQQDAMAEAAMAKAEANAPRTQAKLVAALRKRGAF